MDERLTVAPGVGVRRLRGNEIAKHARCRPLPPSMRLDTIGFVKMHRRYSRIAAPTVVLFFLVGCGPARPKIVLDAPEDAAAQWQGRTLYHTPQGYIYARDEAIAGETDAWIRDVQGHVARTYRGRIGKGLVLVTDTDDPQPVVGSLEELQRLEAVAPLTPRPASRPSVIERRKRLDESGMNEAMACQVATVPLDVTLLDRIGLPRAGLPADIEWMMTCPSNRLAAKVTREFAPKAIEKKKGKAFLLLAAPAMPAACVEAAKVFQLMRDALAFDLWAARQQDWDDGRRGRESDRYVKERAFIISPLLSLAMTIAQSGQAESLSR